ncbi:hypothetical protein CAPTEDRAFT_224745 [Capitella teleta]|uniref:DUF1917 domain-containing protein n=1 Tax=Capitella teleta TaxID=283909 RepID=R7VJP8_CAPTE|nr:hypothetical protein CAPTEDRAFT_224745 [Capitella teleta]|eukprot:ELU16100.1 hypothetical protein CAPTEDRAFT_224745 [Capitella teleta]
MASHPGWYTFLPHHDLQLFLSRHKPSEITNPNMFWVCVSNVHSKPIPEYDEQVTHLMWSQLQKKTDSITLDDIKELATAVGFTQGKWQLTEKSRNVDDLWSTVAEATHGGQLGSMSKVSTKSSATGSSGQLHIICVYTQDFTEAEDVCRVERELRNLGVKGKLVYKPDIFNELGIYFKNPWNISHILYQT